MGSVFWDAQGCILVEFLERGQTINAARYIQTLLKLHQALCNKCPGNKIILQQDTARHHTTHATMERSGHLGRKLFHFLPTVPTWHLLTTIFLVLLRKRPTLRDAGGYLASSASLSTGSWNRVLSEGYFQTCRTMGKTCAKKMETMLKSNRKVCRSR